MCGKTFRRGQSLVEFALVFPLVLLLLGGGVDVARAYFAGIQVADGARQAALYASAVGSTGETYTSSDLASIATNNAGGTAFLGCPTNALSVGFGSTSGDSPPVGFSSVYDQPVVVRCKLPLLVPLFIPSVVIRAEADAAVIPPQAP